MLTPKPEIHRLPIEFIIPNPRQPRQYFDKDKLQELADAIRSTGGLLQPIVVRQKAGSKSDEDKKSMRYEIIAGERRWRACQIAGLDEVDCLVHQCSDEAMLEASIIENVSRADLNPIEEARAYQRMIDEFGYLHDEIAETLGKPRSNISNSLRLLHLENSIQDHLIHGILSAGHGKLLAALPAKQQRLLAQRCIKSQLSVRQLEALIKKEMEAAKSEVHKEVDANIQALENKLSDHMGCKVHVTFDKSKQQGNLTLHFHSLEILSGVLKKIGVEI